MSIKTAVLALGCLVIVMIIGWGRLQIRLVVPDAYRGVIRVTQAPQGEDVGGLFPRISVPPSGVVVVKTVKRFFGWRRIVADWQQSDRPIPAQFSDDAARGAICLWELPTTINPEACFFIGTAAQRDALLKTPEFLQELGRDRRNDGK